MSGRASVESFDQWASSYDAQVSAAEGFPFAGYNDVIAAVVDAVVCVHPAKVLELGVGTGNVAHAISVRDPSIEYWGLDFSTEMLGHAKVKLPDARLLQADLNDLPALALPKFDAVVAAYVLHEFADDRKPDLLEHLFEQRLSTSGIVIVGDVSFLTVEARSEAQRIHAARWDPGEHYFAGDLLMPRLRERRIEAAYMQISVCAGLFRLTRPENR